MISDVRIDEGDWVIYDVVRVIERPNIPGRSPPKSHESSAGFDPVTYDVRVCVGCSVRYRNKKCSTKLTFNPAKHPLVLNRESPMVFSPTELALIDLNGLVRTTDLLRSTFQEHHHCLSTEQTQSAMVWSLKWCSCWRFMFVRLSGRAASRAVYPDIRWWHYLYDAPYLWGYITSYNKELQFSECTMVNFYLKDAFFSVALWGKTVKPWLQCRKKLRKKEMQSIMSQSRKE
jgi:hypothetical protein